MKETYEELKMEVIEFDAEAVDTAVASNPYGRVNG